MVFERIGTNYKLSDVLAAIGLEQMTIADTLLQRRGALANAYIDLLENSDEVSVPDVTENGVHSYQSFCVFIDNRDTVMADLRSKGI